MSNNLKDLDAFQVLRSVYDTTKNSLRVNIVDGTTGGDVDPLEVIIDQETDSIKLGDGVNLITATLSGGKVGLDVNVLNNDFVSNPIITNINTSVNIENNHAFNTNTKKFMLRPRKGDNVNIAFSSGGTSTNYFTLKHGVVYTEDSIRNNGTLTIYFKTTKNNIIEILEWF